MPQHFFILFKNWDCFSKTQFYFALDRDTESSTRGSYLCYMASESVETTRKAIKLNLNPHIYGTFAEIGAGQEVARNFFGAGAASGTIAKTMSAYDMAFSDAIYGVEESGRYVSRTRVKKM